MKYLDKTFTVPAPGTAKYRDNWEKTFAPKKKKESKQENKSGVGEEVEDKDKPS